MCKFVLFLQNIVAVVCNAYFLVLEHLNRLA